MLHDQVLIAFVDCTIKGNWKGIPAPHGETAFIKRALDDENCTIDIFQIDIVRRYLFFKKGAEITIFGNVLSYHAPDVTELTVNEYDAKYHQGIDLSTLD